MFDKKDIISCDNYRQLADYCYETATGLDNIPDSGTIWLPLNHIKDFFKRIAGTGKSYVLVSSFCDYGLYLSQSRPISEHWIEFLRLSNMENPSYLESAVFYNGIHLPPLCNINECHPNDKFSLATSRYTHETLGEIPLEVKKWYLSNNMVPKGIDQRLISIPFGIQKDNEDLWANKWQNKPKKKPTVL